MGGYYYETLKKQDDEVRSFSSGAGWVGLLVIGACGGGNKASSLWKEGKLSSSAGTISFSARGLVSRLTVWIVRWLVTSINGITGLRSEYLSQKLIYCINAQSYITQIFKYASLNISHDMWYHEYVLVIYTNIKSFSISKQWWLSTFKNRQDILWVGNHGQFLEFKHGSYLANTWDEVLLKTAYSSAHYRLLYLLVDTGYQSISDNVIRELITCTRLPTLGTKHNWQCSAHAEENNANYWLSATSRRSTASSRSYHHHAPTQPISDWTVYIEDTFRQALP
jgi:hypothetical protein